MTKIGSKMAIKMDPKKGRFCPFLNFSNILFAYFDLKVILTTWPKNDHFKKTTSKDLISINPYKNGPKNTKMVIFEGQKWSKSQKTGSPN